SINLIAKHYQTGEKLDKEIINVIEKLKYLQTGNFVLGQCEFGLTDMYLHTKPVVKNELELDELLKKSLEDFSIFESDKSFKKYASFSHIFDGGYSAGYYSYMWAEILEADVFSVFKEKGIMNKEVANKYFDSILSKGTTKPAKDLFFDFMGREVNPKAFYERKGL
ncbi:peptidase M3, partial [Candidatus Gracilibacteria bacterium]